MGPKRQHETCKKVLSEVGFEPTPPFGDQKETGMSAEPQYDARSCPMHAHDLADARSCRGRVAGRVRQLYGDKEPAERAKQNRTDLSML